ncbi:MAG: hypothetical protein IJT68_07030 [Lentisphaeria bacterium]|nr:hypothetical protein [Lentisphaeria bacterium]
MDSEDKLFWFIAIFFVIALTTIAVIFIPLSIQKEKAFINLYNAAAKGEASGVIIQIGSQSK